VLEIHTINLPSGSQTRWIHVGLSNLRRITIVKDLQNRIVTLSSFV